MTTELSYDYHSWLTDLGPLAAMALGETLVGLFLTPEGPEADLISARRQGTGRVSQRQTPFLNRVVAQVNEYLTGQRQDFALDLEAAGTEFQKQVWQALLKVPFGQVVTYGQLAARAGRPKAVRAVGGAMNANPIPIIIPCHRVVAADGLGGFGGGLARKVVLLGIEGVTEARLAIQKDLPFGPDR